MSVFDLVVFDPVITERIEGSLATSEAADSAAVTGTVWVSGAIAVTESADLIGLTVGPYQHWPYPHWPTGHWSIAHWPQEPNTGSASGTDAIDSAEATAEVWVSGALAGNDPADTGSFAGEIAAADIEGALAATETPDSCELIGEITDGSVNAVLDGTEAPDVASFTAEAEQPEGTASGGSAYWLPLLLPRPEPVTAVLRASEAPDICLIRAELSWADDDEEFFMLSEAA